MLYDCLRCPMKVKGCLRGRKAAERGGRPREPWNACPLAEMEGKDKGNG